MFTRWVQLPEVADGVGDEPPAVVLLDDVGGDDEDLAGAQLPRVVADPEQPMLPPRHQHQVRVPPRVLVRDLLADCGGCAGDDDDLAEHVLLGEGLERPLDAARRPRERQHHHARRRHHQVHHRVQQPIHRSLI